MKHLIAIILAVLCGPLLAQTCTTTISTGTSLATTISNATAGAVICLNNGNYGSLTTSANKAGRVTIRSVNPQGATISPLTVQSGANNLTFKSLVIGGFDISGSTTRNISILGSAVTAASTINTTSFNQNNILIDGNSFNNIDRGANEGRLHVYWPGGPGTNPSGVVITNNDFIDSPAGSGCSDGVQTGANGVVIGPGNRFIGIVQNCDASIAHVDAIQGYGQRDTQIIGNYFYGNTVAVGIYDGGTNEIIRHNVMIGGGQENKIDIAFANGAVEHNTIYNSTLFRYPAKTGTNAGGTPFRYNIVHASTLSLSGGTASCNMKNSSGNTPTGPGDLVATPSYIGGTPGSIGSGNWAGWRLTAGSAGTSAACDGKDMGSNYFNPAAPTNLHRN